MPPITKNQLGALIVNRVFQAWAVLVGTVGGCFAFWVAVRGFVELQDDPPVVKIVGIVCNLIVASVLPGIMGYFSIRWHKGFVENLADRIGRLEAILDPGRTSSGLQPDGTDPPMGGE